MNKRNSSRRSPAGKPTVRSAREAAVRELDRIEIGGAFVGQVAEAADRSAEVAREATSYVAGVTRNRRWLDFQLGHFYQGKLKKMEPTLRQILRLGLFDLLIEETPPHAAVHEAVALARRLVRPRAAGLVNAVLRNADRRRADLPEPASGDVADDLAVRYSHPTWMVRRWLDRFGLEETTALLAWNNAAPSFGLHAAAEALSFEALQALLTRHHIGFTPSPYLDDFVRVTRLQPVVRADLLTEGQVRVQDEAAALIVRLLDPQPGETVLDACAAPGGKALYAADRMQDQGQVLAFDVHDKRLRLLERAARQQGLTSIQTEAIELRALAARPSPPQADRVLLDAPCTGLGVLARRADLRWHRSPEEVEKMAALQDELLDAAAQLVRPGGLLVYSTCSIAPEENEGRVAAFLRRHPGFAREAATGFVPEALVTEEGDYAALPHRDGIDGAYGARLRKDA